MFIKKFKVLLVLLMVTSIASAYQVFAYVSTPLYFTYSIPGYNDGINTLKRTKARAMVAQTISSVDITPSKDELDVRLKFANGTNASGWHILAEGKKVTFNEVGALLDDTTYYLYIDSRWYYTKSTVVSGTWRVN